MSRLDRYIISAQVPYLLIALAVLNVMLLLQQMSRFADVLDEAVAPFDLAASVLVNLLPGLLLFTLPMSVLVGTSVGFSRMSADSEMVAIGSAGVGMRRIARAPMLLGLFMSLTALVIGFGLVPASSRELREIALRAAIERSESPVSPRYFHTVGEDKVIYVREGDPETGKWKRVFINWRERDGSIRLVTARSGWLDFTANRTELVLKDSVITTLPHDFLEGSGVGSITSERSADLRIRDDRMGLGRRELIERFANRERGVDELGFKELMDEGSKGETPESRRDAQIALQKRLSLCFAPLLFSLLGTALGTRAGRGGRANGVFISLLVMLLYYLLSLVGEQLSRAGKIPTFLGAWFSFGAASSFSLFVFYGRSMPAVGAIRELKLFKSARGYLARHKIKRAKSSRTLNIPSVLDYTITKYFSYYFVLIVFVLVSVFFIFTLFELTRFIIPNDVEYGVVLRYFFYLTPYTLNAVLPISTLLAVIVTLALMARRSEVAAWLSVGQSAYRLFLPCMVLAAFIGGFVSIVGEGLLPYANRKQNALRMIIRGGGVSEATDGGLKWVSAPDRFNVVYSFRSFGGEQFKDLTIYEFDDRNIHLRRVVRGENASVSPGGGIDFEGRRRAIDFDAGAGAEPAAKWFLEPSHLSLFKQTNKRPDELNAAEMRALIHAFKARGDDPRLYSVALEKRKSEPFLPLIMTLVGAPLALAFGRRSPIIPICGAIFISLLFLAVNAALHEAGARALLSPKVAGWFGVFTFSTLGLMLLSRVKT